MIRYYSWASRWWLTFGASTRVTVVVPLVCLSVTMLTATLCTWFTRPSRGVIGFFMVLSRLCCLDFPENALFWSFGIIAYHCYLFYSLVSSQQTEKTVMASFQDEVCTLSKSMQCAFLWLLQFVHLLELVLASWLHAQATDCSTCWGFCTSVLLKCVTKLLSWVTSGC